MQPQPSAELTALRQEYDQTCAKRTEHHDSLTKAQQELAQLVEQRADHLENSTAVPAELARDIRNREVEVQGFADVVRRYDRRIEVVGKSLQDLQRSHEVAAAQHDFAIASDNAHRAQRDLRQALLAFAAETFPPLLRSVKSAFASAEQAHDRLKRLGLESSNLSPDLYGSLVEAQIGPLLERLAPGCRDELMKLRVAERTRAA